jgi:hypothetical protein
MWRMPVAACYDLCSTNSVVHICLCYKTGVHQVYVLFYLLADGLHRQVATEGDQGAWTE